MQITKITTSAGPHVPEAHQLSEKQLYDETNYHRAKELSEKMLEKGLITADEYDKLLDEIRKIFVPILAELL